MNKKKIQTRIGRRNSPQKAPPKVCLLHPQKKALCHYQKTPSESRLGWCSNWGGNSFLLQALFGCEQNGCDRNASLLVLITCIFSSQSAYKNFYWKLFIHKMLKDIVCEKCLKNLFL